MPKDINSSAVMECLFLKREIKICNQDAGIFTVSICYTDKTLFKLLMFLRHFHGVAAVLFLVLLEEVAPV